jgi:hypothetical protein
MTACETCWNTAYRIARMTGRHQAEVYQELIKANPSDGNHGDVSKPSNDARLT